MGARDRSGDLRRRAEATSGGTPPTEGADPVGSKTGPRRRARSTVDRGETPPRPVLGLLGALGLRLGALLPRRVAYALGGAGGWLASFFPTRERLATRVNLALCLPELSELERKRLARRSFMETGRMLLELSQMWLWERERLLALVREVRGEQHLRVGLAAGQGVILVLPHLGSWELTGLHCFANYRMTALYRAPRVREMDAIYTRARERFGGRMVPAGAGGVRALYQALGRGELVCMLPDQDPGRGAGVFAPFFGHPANTSSLLPRLAQRSGAAVVFGYGERRARGLGFTLHFTPGSEQIGDPDLMTAVTAVNRDVEACVRALPEQYLWSYKRFRFQPPGAQSPYKSRAS